MGSHFNIACMSEEPEIPQEFSCGGHTWQYYTYDGGNRHQWYRPFTDSEVADKAVPFDSLDDLREDDDFFVAWPVSDDPVYLIELHHSPSLGTYEVTASETRLSNGITDPLGLDYHVETEDLGVAIDAVNDFARELS